MDYHWNQDWDWSLNMPGIGFPKRLFVMRHSERVDQVIGKDWHLKAFDESGKYQPFDLNMPTKLYGRDHLEDWSRDTPITKFGMFIAERVGIGCLVNDLVPDMVYASPSLRCVQTATGVLQGMKRLDIPIRIKPGLFECAWLNGIPDFLSLQDLEKYGFNIDKSYTPIVAKDRLCSKCEDEVFYNGRVHYVLQHIIRRQEPVRKDTAVLVVAHASTPDLAAGYFMKLRRLGTDYEYGSIIAKKVPYCTFISFEKSRGYDERWKRVELLPSFTSHGFTNRPDFHFLDRKTRDRNNNYI